ncbi:MAG: glycosyltransferase family 39 protein [Deltaproteobacteria bacterium]|nr:glycosyltransferase family 39 protein [Deltaproteobacteria bacterium]
MRLCAGPRTPSYLPSVLFLAIAILWLRLEDITLFSVDGVVYSAIAKLLAQKPIWQWTQMNWVDGRLYNDHPPLMKWVLAASIRLFGSTSLAVVLPPVVFSTATVGLLYQTAKELWDDRYALYSAIILCLTPPFIRDGRNPMLEPPLIFFLCLALYLGIIAMKGRRVGYAWIAGWALAAGWLTKGPPILIAAPALTWLAFSYDLDRPTALRLALRSTLGFLIPLFVFELWHHSASGHWFHDDYFRAQIAPAALETTPQTADTLFYFKDVLTRQWPWLLPALLSPLFVFRSAEKTGRAVFFLGLILWMGPLIAFSFFQKKSSWYANLTTPALALLAAIPFQMKASGRNTKKLLARSCLALGVILLFLGATLPSLFRYPRPAEEFFHSIGQTEIPALTRGVAVSDCVGLDVWKGSSLVYYYLGARLIANCDPAAPFRIESAKGTPPPNFRLLYQDSHFALLQKVPLISYPSHDLMRR